MKLYTRILHALLRNPVALLAPVIVVVIMLTPLGRNFDPVAIWYDRSYDALSLTGILGPFVAAVGAWEGMRETRLRKRSGEQSTIWATQVTAWAKITVWGLLFYLLIWAVVFWMTATQATWGGPLFGPPLMGAVAILALSALGFTIGDRWSSYFAAPVVGVGLLVVQNELASLGTAHNPIGYLTPNLASPEGFIVWYNVRSDLIIVQLTFLCGLLAVASLALRRYSIGRKLYPGILVVCGIILIAASFAGAASSSVDRHGVRVPLVYNAASDQPIPYTLVCDQAVLRICVHPAYRAELTQLSTLVNHLAAPLIGLPGAPTRAEQRPPGNIGNFWHIDGNVLVMPPFAAHASSWTDPTFIQRTSTHIAVGLVLVPGPTTASPGSKHINLTTTPQAIALYLLEQVNVTPDPGSLQVSPQARTFEQQFVAQPTAARHTWLVQNYDRVFHLSSSEK